MMLIECDTCRGRAQRRCGECVVTVLATMPIPLPYRTAAPQALGAAALSRDDRGVLAQAPTARVAAAADWAPLDCTEAAAVELFVRAGMVDAREASHLRALRQDWQRHRAVG